ncbi:IS66 family transposase, partial [Ligilactobacillus equi]|uniref:IS66 family transposase n=1 Tax=Ligilactobacillus equi TaxID=137357 RepID=UPI0039BD6D9A
HSYFSASSLAEIIRNKYELAVPLNRQEILFKSYGLPITSKQMSESVIKLSQHYLQLLYDRLLEELLLEEVIIWMKLRMKCWLRIQKATKL